MGTLFTLPVIQVDEVGELLQWAAQNHIQTIATSAKARQSLRQAIVQKPTLLLLGSEGEGLPPSLLSAADQQITIPISGSATSLNLAVAAAILIYELSQK
jgi:TrmH family RNA methyltransferase